MKSIIIIPSRMASTRFPGKPLAHINGIPMVQRVWQQAINSGVGDVYVACSENEVYDLIVKVGGKAILTDPNLPSGTDRIYSAYQKIDNKSDIECIINLQGDMPMITADHIRKVIEPLRNNYSLGTLATTLKEDEIIDPNVTKVSINLNKNNIGKAIEFFRVKNKVDEKTFHHVGIYSFTVASLEKFVNLPKSNNEISLKLEQCRAMDAGMSIGVSYVSNIPRSIDTKDDLISIENIIIENNEKN